MISERRTIHLGRFLVFVFACIVIAAGFSQSTNPTAQSETRTHEFTITAGADVRQMHYRWRNNNGGETAHQLLFATTSNPGGFDAAYDIAIDSGSMYVVGVSSTADWRIEKRSLADGALIYATTSNPGNGDFVYAVAIDSSSMYLAGVSSSVDWRIEKRALADGTLLFATTSNPGTTDSLRAIAIDSSSMYLAGYQSNVDWRIEKRALADGALLFATTSNPGAIDAARAIAIDSSSMYVAGESGGSWYIEKRSQANGALLFATSSDAGGEGAIYAIAVDSSSMYLAGHKNGGTWYVEKRSLSDGTLFFATTSLAIFSEAHAIAVDSSSMYVAGFVSESDTNWRIEKRALADGTLLFATTSDPSGEDFAEGIAIDSSSMYVVGYEDDVDWRIEKRSLGVDIVGTFAALEDISYSFAKNFIKRLRIEISNEGGTQTSQAYRIEYATSTNGPWTEVGSSTAHFVMANSQYLVDGERTYDVSPGLTNENTTFTPGHLMDTGATTPSVSLDTVNFTELEYSILATSTAIQGQTYYFRLTNNGTSLDTYSIYASATIASDFEITNVVVNNGSAITLTPNTTTSISINYTVSGGPGCGPVFYGGYVTTTLYRSGVSSTCGTTNSNTISESSLYCYKVTTSTHNCPNSTSTASANATSTLDLYYFAEATDASSSFSSENWQAIVYARDGQGGIETATTSASGVELNTLLAISVPAGTLDYGTLDKGTNTSSTNQSSTIKNAGNSSTTLRVNGTAMTSGANSIATSSQHYATSTFAYGGNEQALQETATDVSGFTIARPPLTRWATTTALQSGVMNHRATTYNGFVYSLGGEISNFTSTVRFAPINATGSLGSWTTTTPLPNTTAHFGAVAVNGFMYSIGGDISSTNTTRIATVYFAPINTTGSLGTWATTTPLPNALSHFVASTYAGYIYAVGGAASTSATSTIHFAPINATGSLGAWATTTPFPYAMTAAAGTIENGYMYVLGGYANGGSATSSVYTAPINATGSLGSWRTTTPLPHAFTDHAVLANNGILYSIGGLDDFIFDYVDAVYFAHISASGSVGTWATTTPLPFVNSNFPAVSNNGIGYVIGGWNSSHGQTSTVRFAPLASRNTYWGWSAPATSTKGSYQSTITYTAVFSP